MTDVEKSENLHIWHVFDEKMSPHMGQFLQDGKNEQTLSKKNIFWRFTVTKRFDFFNFSQLF